MNGRHSDGTRNRKVRRQEAHLCVQHTLVRGRDSDKLRQRIMTKEELLTLIE